MLKDPSATSTRAKLAQPKPTDAKPAGAKPAEAKIKPDQAKPAEPKAGAAKIAERATKPTAANVVAKSAVRRPVREMDDLERLIQQRAYELWESEGRPEGREQAHWQLAEREILGGAAAGRA